MVAISKPPGTVIIRDRPRYYDQLHGSRKAVSSTSVTSQVSARIDNIEISRFLLCIESKVFIQIHHHTPFPSKVYTTNPPLFLCLGSPAASNVPFPNLLNPCAVLCPGAIHVTLLPSASKNAVVPLSNPYSKLTCAGTS
jgi:hypothetical protein